MTMDKYGASKEDLLQGLQNEEASIMQQIQKTLDPSSKTASDRSELERRLQSVKSKISELMEA